MLNDLELGWVAQVDAQAMNLSLRDRAHLLGYFPAEGEEKKGEANSSFKTSPLSKEVRQPPPLRRPTAPARAPIAGSIAQRPRIIVRM